MGRTFCRKIYFVQKFATISFFGELTKTGQKLSFICPARVREAQIQSCFKRNVEFHYPTNTVKSEDISKNFKGQS